MGQAWCKERTSKAQDSKSPLDRVFVRCAHRIYPSLKEEGSVLGGATQRVTSSEIGYAGSPPREVLTRGRSIDSVDRPFHPNDWVDVNLEVPSTPRASSVLTNLTVDTSLYPATTPTSSCSNLKDVTPVPPPRRRKRNRGRPLPPKPDEIAENPSHNPKQVDASGEPLYSSVKSPKTSGDEQESEDEIRTEKPSSLQEDTRHESKKAKEIYEHKVNGTGRIISSDVVSGKRTSSSEEKKTWRASEPGQHYRKVRESEEYERFARHQSAKDSSTPNRQDRRKPREAPRDEAEKSGANARPKNYSTVSLPNYDELDVSRHLARRTRDEGAVGEKKARRPVRSSTGSLPAESFLSPFSEKTTVRLEDYIPRRGSSENLSSYQVLRKLDCSENGVVDGAFVKYDPSKLEDWELGDIGNCELNHHRRLFSESPSASDINDEKRSRDAEDVVDFSRSTEIGVAESTFLRRHSHRDGAESTTSLQKPVAFGKTPSPLPTEDETSRTSKDHEDWIVAQNRPHLRYFEPPTLEGSCRTSSACDNTCSPTSVKPFFLNEDKNTILDTIDETRRNGALADRSVQSRMILGRSLSNESEPQEDAFESKELRVRRPASTDVLIRTISEESLPREMLEGADRELDDFFDEKLAKDACNEVRREGMGQKIAGKTPPPSPEPRIRAEILDNDHSTLLKVLKEEAAEGSNLSSMTPSLTELEAALSDMLEKEDSQEDRVQSDETFGGEKDSRCTVKLIEPDIVPVEKTPGGFEDVVQSVVCGDVQIETQGRTADKSLVDEDLEERMDEVPVSLGQILEDRKPAKGRKVSFCAWEENRMAEVDLGSDREPVDRTGDSVQKTVHDSGEERLGHASEEFDVARIALSHDSNVESRNDPWCAPEKPSRLHLDAEDFVAHTANVPTPPRRKNKGSLAVVKKEIENGSAIADPYPNDRLI